MLIYANVVGNLTFLVKTEIYYYFLDINISMYQKVLRAQVWCACGRACVYACMCVHVHVHMLMSASLISMLKVAGL